MTEIDIQRCSRRCSQTDRELQPGETYYSTLVPSDSGFQRRDFAAEAWNGPPPEAVAWWKSQLPGLGARRAHWAPNDVILDYFQLLEADPTKNDVRYVLALLMVRRRIARWEQTEMDPSGEERMVLYCPRQELEFRVPVAAPSPERVAIIQEELAKLLITPAVG